MELLATGPWHHYGKRLCRIVLRVYQSINREYVTHTQYTEPSGFTCYEEGVYLTNNAQAAVANFCRRCVLLSEDSGEVLTTAEVELWLMNTKGEPK